MAKITIAGEAVVVTSSCKLEDLKQVAKYRPEALTLFGGEDGKEPIFRVAVVEHGAGSIGKYGAEFSTHTHDDEKLASVTLVFPDGFSGGDIKECVSDQLGSAILNLNKLEATIPGVLEEIAAEKAQILENISVAQ